MVSRTPASREHEHHIGRGCLLKDRADQFVGRLVREGEQAGVAPLGGKPVGVRAMVAESVHGGVQFVDADACEWPLEPDGPKRTRPKEDALFQVRGRLALVRVELPDMGELWRATELPQARFEPAAGEERAVGAVSSCQQHASAAALSGCG